MTSGVNLDRARAAKSEAMRVFSAIVGDAAVGVASLGEGKYGVVHGQGLDVDAMKARIMSLISNIAPEAQGITVGAATIDAGDGLTEENLTKGVIHALNEECVQGEPQPDMCQPEV